MAEDRATATSDPSVRPAVAAGVVTAIALTIALTVALASGIFTAVDLISAGGKAPSAPLIAADFGANSFDQEWSGFDGQGFYVAARDFPDLKAAAPYMDAPRYRFLRILTPAIASVGGQGAPVAYLLTALSVLGAALAVGSVAYLADASGRPAALGYLAVVPLLFGIIGSLADPLAVGLLFLGLVFAHRRQHLVAVGWLILAALTREQMAVFAAVIGVGALLDGLRLRRAALYLLPALAIFGWYLALGQIVGGSLPDRFDVLAILSAELEGKVLGFVALGLSLWGAWAWRSMRAVSLVSLVAGLWVLGYFRGVFEVGLLAVPRTTAPGITLGLVALVGVVVRRPARRPEPGVVSPAEIGP